MTPVHRLAAFAHGDRGGNPAGVVLCDELPSPETMQRIAAEVGYSETAFAARTAEGWRVRYFAPACEVPFCGHATIALGAALARAHGDGIFPLLLNDGRITVEGAWGPSGAHAALQSPPTRSRAAPDELVGDALRVFGYGEDELDPRLPPAIIEAGATHLLLALSRRESLARMRYALEEGRALMHGAGVVTVALVVAESAQRFRARHPFASGGVYEDPATGAGAAALAGYLRDAAWPHGGEIEILQGEEMGVPCHLRASFGAAPGASVRVAGLVRPIV